MEYIVYNEEVKSKNSRKRFYPNQKKSDVQIYDGLNYRHWDTWNEGKIQSCFLQRKEGATGIDIDERRKF
jgi:hypothetical protein